MSRFIDELRRLCEARSNIGAHDRRLSAASGLTIIYQAERAPDIVALDRQLKALVAKQGLAELAAICRQTFQDHRRLSNGRSACEMAFEALLAPIEGTSDPEEREANLEAYEAWWQQDQSNPAAAGVFALALAMTGFAYRGEDWAGDVSDSQWALLRDFSSRAEAVLGRADKGRSSCWLWNRCNMHVSFVAYGIAEATSYEVAAAFDATMHLDPLEVGIYAERVNQLLPRWGGSFEALEQFARQSYATTRRELGAELYARVYDTIVRYEDPKETLIDYFLLRDGFDDWLQRVPSQALANRFAAHAHAAQDIATLTRLFQGTIVEIHPLHWFNPQQPLLAWEAVSRAHARRH